MSMIGTKTPEEVKDFSLDWQKDLGTDTIPGNASLWAVSPSGPSVTATSVASSGTLTTVWISGGTSGQVYQVKNTVTTNGGRELTSTFRLLVMNNSFV